MLLATILVAVLLLVGVALVSQPASRPQSIRVEQRMDTPQVRRKNQSGRY